MNNYAEFDNGRLRCHHTVTLRPDPSGFPMHAHDMCEILYFIGGNARYLVEGSVYTLAPGDLLIMRPSEAHRLLISQDMPYERAAVHFSPDIPNGTTGLLNAFFDRPLGRKNQWTAADFSSGHYASCLEAIIRAIDSGADDMHVTAPLTSLLVELSDAYRSYTESASPHNTDSHTSGDGRDISTQMVDYVNRNLLENISPETLAKTFYLSVSQSGRIFRAAVGSPVGEYIRIKRLLFAREKIRQGIPAARACRECGFDDYSSFWRAYKARFGATPSKDK